ncbi:hypothetical protein BDP27DRAFT_1412357 [Rhodocollybia butyracea]|uniref:Uncharacterized protein n=1 Tax=Rhodocollybia butyracea TaxID=206335 RepID=A0A9P5QAD6_9AGAR|nr:hypothetical protein BDP27DRAFT_1412357 [Rhodocollybia butyracea]
MHRFDAFDESASVVIEDKENSALFILFLVFQLTSLGGLLITIFTASLCPMVKKRHLSWSSFMFSWIISCVSYSLLAGESINWQPEFHLCLTQAVLIYTVPTLTASASLGLVVRVLISVYCFTATSGPTTNSNSTERPRPARASHRVWMFILVIFPYIFGGGMFALSLVIGLKDRSTVTRAPGGFYCDMINTVPGRVSAIMVTAIMAICVCLCATIAVVLRRNWSIFYRETTGTPLSTVMRVLVFTLFSMVAVVLGLVFFFTPRSSHGPAMELVLSIIPLSAVLVFGTQRDLVRSWKAGFEACFHWMCPPRTQLRGANPDASGSFLRPCSNSSEDTVFNIAITEIPLAVEPTWRSHAAPGSRFFRFS